MSALGLAALLASASGCLTYSTMATSPDPTTEFALMGSEVAGAALLGVLTSEEYGGFVPATGVMLGGIILFDLLTYVTYQVVK
ncbi:MAG: hypothetical protein IPI49_07580 [Myxococcales bacterium]|nr:hypothetical protein [Myxococcales bacterium]